MALPESQHFVKLFQHWQQEELEKMVNAYIETAEKGGIFPIGFLYTTEKEQESGVETIKHFCAVTFQRPNLTELGNVVVPNAGN